MSRGHPVLSAGLTCLLSVALAACGGTESFSEPESAGAHEHAVCSRSMTTTFGATDNFSPVTSDPVSYNPALPAFVSYLSSIGVPTSDLKTFDDLTVDHHMVATLKHGLRPCFLSTCTLQLCFRATASSMAAQNDQVAVYNTDFSTNTFPVLYSSPLVPNLTSSWLSASTATLCVDLTSKMLTGDVGDMLQFRLQDDSAVDYIQLRLNC